MTGAPRLSFIIPVRDDADRLRHCLAAIAATDAPRSDVEVVVIDNGSTDGSADVASRSGARVLKEPQGSVAELRNRGTRAARGELLAFVDADHEVDPAWVRAALETSAAPDVGVVGAACHAPRNGSWVQRLYDLFRDRPAQPCDVVWLGSGNMVVRRSLFNRLNGFDARLESCEDVDLCRRARRLGYRVVHDPRLKNVHLGDPPTLGALFVGELWRGRDNLRASLRRPISLRCAISAAIPVIDLAALAAAVMTPVLWPIAGAWPLVAGGGLFCTLSLLRAARLVARHPHVTGLECVRAVVVALVYDTARALALVIRAPHRRRWSARRVEASLG